jgi:NADH pyrophosphatase NudC (nudix superfamily)
VKIRYFGFFGATLRLRLLSLRQQLEQESLSESTGSQPDTASGSTTSNVSQAARLCPKCGQPMRFLRTLAPNPCRSP